jgi:hypothetical protein
VSDMETLRQALEEAGGKAEEAGGTTATATA